MERIDQDARLRLHLPDGAVLRRRPPPPCAGVDLRAFLAGPPSHHRLLGDGAACRGARIGTRTGRIFGAVVYVVAPIVVTWSASSASLLAVVLLPWVLVPLVRGASGGSPRRAACASGIAVALMGGVNSTVVLATLPVGRHLAPHAPARAAAARPDHVVDRRPRPRLLLVGRRPRPSRAASGTTTCPTPRPPRSPPRPPRSSNPCAARPSGSTTSRYRRAAHPGRLDARVDGRPHLWRRPSSPLSGWRVWSAAHTRASLSGGHSLAVGVLVIACRLRRRPRWATGRPRATSARGAPWPPCATSASFRPMSPSRWHSASPPWCRDLCSFAAGPGSARTRASGSERRLVGPSHWLRPRRRRRRGPGRNARSGTASSIPRARSAPSRRTGPRRRTGSARIRTTAPRFGSGRLLRRVHVGYGRSTSPSRF